MKRISAETVLQQATSDTAGGWTPPALDPAIIDFYLRRGRQERARAIAEMVRSLFSSPATRRSGEVHPLPARRRPGPDASACGDCADRAA